MNAIHNLRIGRVNSKSGRIRPDLLPVAGTKMYADQSMHGVCNGAFQDDEYVNMQKEQWKRRDKLDVEDIARDHNYLRSKSVIHRNQMEQNSSYYD